METKIARALSYILHPLLIPTYAVLLLLNLPFYLTFALSLEIRIWLMILVFSFTFLIPVAAIITLGYFKMISSPELEDSRERTLPLLITSASYFALLYVLRNSGIPSYFLYFIYGAIFILLTGLIINLFYRVSIHTLAWGAAVASFIGISVRMGIDIPAIIMITILVAGLAGFARLKLNAHNSTQVYLGFIAGAGILLLLTFAL